MIRIIIRMVEETLGKRVKRYREEMGLSQRELGRRAKTSGSYISQLEAGAPRPGAKLLGRIAAALGKDASGLLEDLHEEAPDPEFAEFHRELFTLPPQDISEGYQTFITWIRGRKMQLRETGGKYNAKVVEGEPEEEQELEES